MKTYGKEPESLASITATMLRDLEGFPADKVLLAFKTHAQRSQEFPTTADLVNLIKRNGKPPIRESDIIAIRKKEVCQWTRAEGKIIEEWEAQQRDGWEYANKDQDKNLQKDNENLRKKLQKLQQDYDSLAELIRSERKSKELVSHPLSMQEKIQRTVTAMRQGGASEEDVKIFEESMHAA